MTCRTAAAVCADIQRRAALGETKYGTTLGDARLGRRALLQHAYEEALDLAMYLRAELDREDGECA